MPAPPAPVLLHADLVLRTSRASRAAARARRYARGPGSSTRHDVPFQAHRHGVRSAAARERDEAERLVDVLGDLDGKRRLGERRELRRSIREHVSSRTPRNVPVAPLRGLERSSHAVSRHQRLPRPRAPSSPHGPGRADGSLRRPSCRLPPRPRQDSASSDEMSPTLRHGGILAVARHGRARLVQLRVDSPRGLRGQPRHAFELLLRCGEDRVDRAEVRAAAPGACAGPTPRRSSSSESRRLGSASVGGSRPRSGEPRRGRAVGAGARPTRGRDASGVADPGTIHLLLALCERDDGDARQLVLVHRRRARPTAAPCRRRRRRGSARRRTTRPSRGPSTGTRARANRREITSAIAA